MVVHNKRRQMFFNALRRRQFHNKWKLPYFTLVKRRDTFMFALSKLDTGFCWLFNSQKRWTGLIFSLSRPNCCRLKQKRFVYPGVPTCVKTLRDRRRSNQISTAKFACNEQVQILKPEFLLPVWLIEHTHHRYHGTSNNIRLKHSQSPL